MLGTHGRTRTAEKLAEQAWEQLLSAASSASDTARDTARSVTKATSGLASGAGDQVSTVKDEARRRAAAALDALSGRRPATPWGLLIGAVAAGLAIGWVAASAVRRAAAAREAAEPVYGVTEVEEPIEPLR